MFLGQVGTVEDVHSNISNKSNFESSFMKKRNATENAAERRHKEKMQRQDQYLQLLERLTAAVEKTVNKD